MAERRRHPAHLMILAFHQREGHPYVGDFLTKANGRIARRNARLRVE